MVEWLFLAVPWGCLRFVIVIFPDDTHLLFVTLLTVMDMFTYTISRADSVTVTARLRIILSTVMAMFTYTISGAGCSMVTARLRIILRTVIA